ENYTAKAKEIAASSSFAFLFIAAKIPDYRHRVDGRIPVRRSRSEQHSVGSGPSLRAENQGGQVISVNVPASEKRPPRARNAPNPRLLNLVRHRRRTISLHAKNPDW